LHISAGSLHFLHDSDDPFASGTLSGEGFALKPFDAEETALGVRGVVGPELDPSFETGGFLLGTLTTNNGALQLDGDSTWRVRMSAPPQPVPIVADPEQGFTVTFPFALSGFCRGR
jgi:hypothetical protein